MIRPADRLSAQEINTRLISFNNIIPIPGIDNEASRECFINQTIDSIRRIKYVKLIRDKISTDHCTDATHPAFDPIKAAAWHKRNGNIDEAFWLVFLSTHFGKNKVTGINR